MAKPIRFYLAQIMAKTVHGIMRLFGKNATHFPGMLALKIDPRYLAHVAKAGTVIGVTGTNGKTTTANLIGKYLELAGKDYMHNSFGSNTLNGIASSYVGFSTFLGENRYPYAILEIDERSALRIYGQMTTDYLVITNLFRDSYARNAHPDFIVSVLEKALPETVKLIVNTDDLISSLLSPENPRTGISVPLLEGEAEDRHSRIKDLVNCPQCMSPLTPEFIRYNHIGRYTCSACGFRSPEADYQVVSADLRKQSAIFSAKGEQRAFKLPTSNIVDLYNLLAAATVLHQLDFSWEFLSEQSEAIEVVASRFFDKEVRGKRVLTVLAKACNPIASSRTFDFVRKEPGQKAVVLANGEFKAGGKNLENIAWIYDNDFSYLNAPDIKQVICCGLRYLDFAFCLRLAGVPEERITLEESYDRIPEVIRYEDVDTICILKDLDTELITRKMGAKVVERIEAQG